jgi:hypothetical protein
MKKILFGLIIGFMITLGINVNATEVNHMGVGDSLTLYDRTKTNIRIVEGTTSITDSGYMDLKDQYNKTRISINADSPTHGPVFYLTNLNGDASTYLTYEAGYINGKKIITDDYLNQNYINKSDVQKMIDDAVSKALNK